MAPQDDAPEETPLETGEGSAGEARHQVEGLLKGRVAEGETPSQEELDARQERIGRRRRWGGPPLKEPALAEKSFVEQPDVPPTEPEEPEPTEP